MSYSFPVLIEKYEHEIVTLQQAKQWLRMDIDGYDREDHLINDAIASAVDSVEKDAGLSLGISLYEWNCSGRPREIFGAQNIIEITSVDYWENNVSTALDPSDFRLVRRGQVTTCIDWRSDLQVSRILDYTIKFKAGFAEGKVPAGLLHAIRARISEIYDARGDGVSEKRTFSDKLIFPYRNGYAG